MSGIGIDCTGSFKYKILYDHDYCHTHTHTSYGPHVPGYLGLKKTTMSCFHGEKVFNQLINVHSICCM